MTGDKGSDDTGVGGLSENWATLWEALADSRPDDVAIVIGRTEIAWRAFDDGAARLAGALGALGVGPGTRIAQLLFNCPEYLESTFAAFKLRATPVNVNYRYKGPEIAHVVDDAGAEVLVFHGALGERVADAAPSMPSVRLLLQVDDGTPLVEGARWYHEVRNGATPAERIERSGDDLLLLYTGGTTGRPKGVMWRHVELFGALGFTSYASAGIPVPATAAEVGATAARLRSSGASPVNLCAPPLMHGTALFLAMSTFVMGGTVVLLGSRRFDADELLDLVQRHRVTQISLVGDAFARPINDAADAAERAGMLPDLTSVQRIVSTGATLSAEEKRRLQRRAPDVTIIDMIGASEGGPFAISMTPPGEDPPETATFTAPPNAVTIDPVTGVPLPRGSNEPGMLAVTGPIPRGYWNDPDRTATTFRTIHGARYSVPGDFALIADDGTVTLLGRGSVCINTGGEKVYPEEVEVAVRSHPDVIDTTVVGVPDDRFGETVTAVCSVARPTDPQDVIDAVRARLADYKAPRHVVFVEQVYRAPNGKADYQWARRTAINRLGSSGAQ